MDNALINSYHILLNNIKNVCTELNKPLPLLLAVSKTHQIDKIIDIYNQGQRDFGENYVQELISKATQLSNLAIKWHYIGHIQSNKIKSIAQYASYVHGLSNINHAIKLNNYCQYFNRQIKVLIEVNITNKDSRNGLINFQDVLTLANQINKLTHIQLIGIMGIASNVDDEAIINRDFAELNQIFTKLKQHNLQINTLSIGMSKDYIIAIKNNSNLIRIGSHIFGNRQV